MSKRWHSTNLKIKATYHYIADSFFDTDRIVDRAEVNGGKFARDTGKFTSQRKSLRTTDHQVLTEDIKYDLDISFQVQNIFKK